MRLGPSLLGVGNIVFQVSLAFDATQLRRGIPYRSIVCLSRSPSSNQTLFYIRGNTKHTQSSFYPVYWNWASRSGKTSGLVDVYVE